MESKYKEPFSKLGLRYYGQGREEGREQGREEGREEGHAAGLIEGERGTVRMVLKARGLELGDANRERLDGCTSLDTLKRWSQAALTAGTADEVFS
jgi:predicted transposase YdaD